MQTGAITASSRGGGRLLRLTVLPVQVATLELAAEGGAEREDEQREDSGNGDEPGLPLQHRRPPRETEHDAVDSLCPAKQAHHPEGGVVRRAISRRRGGRPRRADGAPTRTAFCTTRSAAQSR